MDSEMRKWLDSIDGKLLKIDAILNPTAQQVVHYVLQYTNVRFMIDGRKFYMWKADEGMHQEMADQYFITGGIRLMIESDHVLQIRPVDSDDKPISMETANKAVRHPALRDLRKVIVKEIIMCG